MPSMKIRDRAPALNRWWQANLDDANLAALLEMAGDAADPHRVALRRFATIHGFASVLDVGGGTGVDAFALRKEMLPETRIAVLDVTPFLLNRLRAPAKLAGVELKLGSAEYIDWPCASWELVCCKGLLEHLPHYRLALAEMIRVASRAVRVVSRKGFWTKPTLIRKESGVHANRYEIKEIGEFLDFHPRVERWAFSDDRQVLTVSIGDMACHSSS